MLLLLVAEPDVRTALTCSATCPGFHLFPVDSRNTLEIHWQTKRSHIGGLWPGFAVCYSSCRKTCNNNHINTPRFQRLTNINVKVRTVWFISEKVPRKVFTLLLSSQNFYVGPIWFKKWANNMSPNTGPGVLGPQLLSVVEFLKALIWVLCYFQVKTSLYG